MSTKFVSTLTDYKLQYLKEFEQRNKHLSIPAESLFKVVEKTLSQLQEPITWADFKSYYDGSHWQKIEFPDEKTSAKTHSHNKNTSNSLNTIIESKKALSNYQLGVAKDERRIQSEGFKWKREKETEVPLKRVDIIPEPTSTFDNSYKTNINEDQSFQSYKQNVDEPIHENTINSKTTINTNKIEKKNGSTLGLTFGFIFSLLGGFIGTGFGLNYAFGGYSKSTKILGWIMIVLGIIMSAIFKNL